MKEYDLQDEIRDCSWLMEKIQTRPEYAQNLYAAMCNMRWCKRDTWPILAEHYWSASWRGSGGIVADLVGKGEDYMDYYCSGMGGLNQDYEGNETNEEWQKRTGFVPEGTVTEEIAKDLADIGWFPVPYPDNE